MHYRLDDKAENLYMRRKITEKLREWKNNPDRKPLILMGARQVGKTWTMKDFGKSEYGNVAYVNFDDNVTAKDLFVEDYDISRIIRVLQAITKTSITPGKTLIVLDELQMAKRGLHSLKYFQENAPEYHVVAAGSLLGMTIAGEEPFPVGKVDILHMYPLDFEEFLNAIGMTSLSELFHQPDWKTLDILKTKYVDCLRQYFYVGGMPAVVESYVRKQDLSDVRRMQKNILEIYRSDVSRHAAPNDAVRIGAVLKALPSQLAKENKKFFYNVIKQGARAKEYETAICWLEDAGLVYRVSRVKELHMPVKFYVDLSAFKLFFLDLGLLGCLSDVPASLVLAGNNIFIEYKGAFTEQFALQQFVSMGVPAYYWSRDNSSAEIDFVLQDGDRVVPVEVKAGENVRAKSMAEYVRSHPEDRLRGLRMSMKGYVNQGWMENIPLYGIHKFFAR